MRILQVIPSMDPRTGGPAEGVRQLVMAAQARQQHMDVVCLDDPSMPYLANPPHNLYALGPVSTKYGYSSRLATWLKANGARYDYVVVNGLWQYHGAAVWRAMRRARVPYFVWTHGMLDPWFRRTYPIKHLKKLAYWSLVERRVLRDARAVLFTCEEERLLARLSFPGYDCHELVCGYGIATPRVDLTACKRRFFEAFPALADRRIVLFLGRLHEKKGCDVLIDAFARVSGSDHNLRLVMAGPGSEDWIARLKGQAERLGLGDRIVWPGMLTGELKWGAFAAAERFALPSHQENFGIAVVEALACGTPVVISDKVNIWREIDEDRAGWVGEDTVGGTEQALAAALSVSPEEDARARGRARESFVRRFEISTVADRMEHSLRSLL